MAAECEGVVLEHPRRIRASQDDFRIEIGELTRTAAIEEIRGEILVLIGAMNKRIDRFDERAGRMERRLDLLEA